MNFLNKLEKKFGRYAIPHLTRYIIATYVAGYILSAVNGANGTFLTYLTLSPSLILRGQIWRIFSWILIPPSSLGIFTIFMLFFYYSVGTQLERAWGDFLYNVYVFGGLILTIIGAFVLYAFSRPFDFGALFSTYYVSLSLILGFAMTYPDHQVLFYFFIPLKMKWLAVIDLAYIAYAVWQYARVGLLIPGIVVIGCSLANALIFFLMTRNYKRTAQQRRQQREWHRNMRTGPYFGQYGSGRQSGTGQGTGRTQGGTGTSWGAGPANSGSQAKGQPRHRCAICGRTELDNPDLEFRYCTKCRGYYEYCNDHLFTHTHKQ